MVEGIEGERIQSQVISFHFWIKAICQSSGTNAVYLTLVTFS